MKKTLLLQTALVAAAGLFVADIANAQTKEVPIGVTVGGYMVRNFHFQDKGDRQSTNNPSKSFGPADTEVWFNIRGVLDNGTVVGGRVELEGASEGDQIDESYLFVEKADIGRVEIGSTDRVSNKMLYFAPTAIPGHSTTQVSDNNSTITPFSMWFQNAGNDSEGINLYTASNRYFGSKAGKGLQLGVSYIPDVCEDRGQSFGANAVTQASGRCDQAFGSVSGANKRDTYLAAANYLESFGPVDVALYTGFISSQVAVGVRNERNTGWQAGSQLTYNVGDGSTIQLGGGYTNEEMDTTAAGSGTSNVDRHGWTLGLRYLTNGAANGSIGLGIEYGNGETEANLNVETYMLGVTYQVAKGVLTFVGAGVNDVDGVGVASDNKQTYGVMGIRLDF